MPDRAKVKGVKKKPNKPYLPWLKGHGDDP